MVHVTAVIKRKVRSLPCATSSFVCILLVTGTYTIYFVNKPPYPLEGYSPRPKSLGAVTKTSPLSTHDTHSTPNRSFVVETCAGSPTSYHSSRKNASLQGPEKLIFLYNLPEWFLASHSRNVLLACSRRCAMTSDVNEVQKADAVIVHVSGIAEPRPPPSFRSDPRQIWIAFGLESPFLYSGHHNSPAWRGVFNWTMTYRTDSDVFHPIGFLTLRSTPSLKNFTRIALSKTKPVAWFVSNCDTQSRRDEYVRELQKHIAVDVYGQCGPLKCSGEHWTTDDCLRMASSTYYFYLSFENSLCRDYLTEKFLKVFDKVNMIPVVRGGADYERYFPPSTFINTADFASPRHLATHLKTLMADTEKYAEMMKAKDSLIRVSEKCSRVRIFCELCEMLHSENIRQRVYPDFMEWIGEEVCREPTDV